MGFVPLEPLRVLFKAKLPPVLDRGDIAVWEPFKDQRQQYLVAWRSHGWKLVSIESYFGVRIDEDEIDDAIVGGYASFEWLTFEPDPSALNEQIPLGRIPFAWRPALDRDYRLNDEGEADDPEQTVLGLFGRIRKSLRG